MKAIIQVEITLPDNIETTEEAEEFMDEVDYAFTYQTTLGEREISAYLDYTTMNCEIRH